MKKTTTAAKLAVLSLLLIPFVAKNQEIYKDDPEMLAKFEDLTVADLEIGEVSKEDGVHSARISSPTRGFTSRLDQKWRPASVHSDKVLTLTEAEPLESKAAVEALTVPGIYSYLDAAGDIKVVVVIDAETAADQQQSIASFALFEALRYDLPADHIIPGDGVVLVDGDTIAGEVEYVVAAAAVKVLEDVPGVMEL